MAGSPAGQQPAAICALKSPIDAVHILEGVRAGLIPRVSRRLTGYERQAIRAGTVWVWEEGETKMKRWTDGKKWGASRVGNGGFLLYTEMNEPNESANMYGAYTNHSMGRPAPCLLKQTYSTTSNEDGHVKYWHVVAYTNKFMPGYDGSNPLPLPHQLPLLANITIEPGRYPDWEQQRDTTEAYARRPPPGTVNPSQSPTTATGPATTSSATHQAAAGPSQPSRLPSPPSIYPPSGNVPYASPPYGPRRSRDSRGEPMWPYQTPGYHPDDQNQNQPYGGMPNGQYPYGSYDFQHLPPNGGAPLHNRLNEPYNLPRRDRPSPPRSAYDSAYPLAPGYPPYPRIDRYPDVSPDYTSRPPQIQIRTHEPVDVKPIYEDGHQDKNQLTVRLPLTPVSASSVNGDLPSLGPSPKLSINNNLLNPHDGSDRATLTLPPLMRSVHEGASPVSPTGRVSPNGDVLPSEDARQLDGLGRRAY